MECSGRGMVFNWTQNFWSLKKKFLDLWIVKLNYSNFSSKYVLNVAYQIVGEQETITYFQELGHLANSEKDFPSNMTKYFLEFLE